MFDSYRPSVALFARLYLEGSQVQVGWEDYAIDDVTSILEGASNLHKCKHILQTHTPATATTMFLQEWNCISSSM